MQRNVHVIPSYFEAEIRRITIQASLGKKEFPKPHFNGTKLGVVFVSAIPEIAGNVKLEVEVNAGLSKEQDSIFKITRAKRAGGVTQVVGYLLSKFKVLNSIPSTTTKKQNEV
jgi:hypothetical protein